jgi:hypothetical protein
MILSVLHDSPFRLDFNMIEALHRQPPRRIFV